MTAMELMKDPAYKSPELAKLLEERGPVPSLDATTDIHALRETLRQRKLELPAAGGATASDIDETDHSIPTRDGTNITVRIRRGSKSNEGPFNGVAVNVDYRLAPEIKFPILVYDCFDAVRWTAAHAGVHRGDLTKGFIVAGISAGANMACTASHLARDEKLQPPLTGVYLSIPSLLSQASVPDRFKEEYLAQE
ncbi:Alpha/Beta hydrolase protein [Clohesyomyces aquaticus]|uniref:Alpha/Beta hydrolase protein n=1 Tax=Clohesyomyces aquaticus TaxID=1231657 RepID=A0A1Y1YTI6_9PLEO|nr:Alpha/Beta hydrolase protein [Clohesyomyces aquaticus]